MYVDLLCVQTRDTFYFVLCLLVLQNHKQPVKPHLKKKMCLLEFFVRYLSNLAKKHNEKSQREKKAF